MSAVTIRQATLEDVAACAAVKNAWIDETGWMPRIHPADDLERHYRETVFSQREVWIAGDPVTGFAALDVEDGELTSLFVATRGRGIGRQLLDRVKVDQTRLKAWTFVANEGARRFYSREGFREVARTQGDNEEGLPDVLMAWEAAS